MAHEKELCNQESLEDEERVQAVEHEIQEKEEILMKLMDTVKGFGPMKQEYERVLNQISSLETQRRELEEELEKAKKAALDQPATMNRVDKLHEQLRSTKDDLSKMRLERTKKEAAFRVMQRGNQQCEAMQRELKKLKESRVALIKAQKKQNQQFINMRKEQTQKAQQMRKADIKKQQMMNSLKSEVERKERLLGLKAREIGRINSKLKATGVYLQSVLKTQARQRGVLGGKMESGRGKDREGLAEVDTVALNSAKVRHIDPQHTPLLASDLSYAACRPFSTQWWRTGWKPGVAEPSWHRRPSS